MILLCTDLHLDEKPANEYRWRVFDELDRACREYPVTRVACLGDVTDKRDRFPAEMVNRFVSCWAAVADILRLRVGMDYPEEESLVDILDGNHTRLLGSGGSFWEFVSRVPDITYITTPTTRDDGRLLLLPFSPNPREEWRGLVTGEVESIFLHATRSGAIAENGFALAGQDLPPIPRRVKVYSGDVHNQQVVDNWTFVGAPHPVKFGDKYLGRFLLLDDESYEVVGEVPVATIGKRVVEVSSVADLESVETRPGDQVVVRASVSTSDPDLDWASMERAVEQWARERGVEISSIEGGYEVAAQSGTQTAGDLDPRETLRAFATEEGVAGDRLDLGLELLEAAGASS